MQHIIQIGECTSKGLHLPSTWPVYLMCFMHLPTLGRMVQFMYVVQIPISVLLAD